VALEVDAAPAVHLAAHGGIRADAGDLHVASSTSAGDDCPIRWNPGDRHQDQHAGSSWTNQGANDPTHHGAPDWGADRLADDSPHQREHDGTNPQAERYTDHGDCHHARANSYL